MKTRTIAIGALAFLVIVGVLVALTFQFHWFGLGVTKMDLSTAPQVSATVTNCDDAKKAHGLLDRGDPGELRDYGLNINRDKTPEEIMKLVESPLLRVEQVLKDLGCDGTSPAAPPSVTPSSGEPEPSESPSSDPTQTSKATASATASTSPEPEESELAEVSVKPSPTLDPMKVRTWSELIEFAPEGLAEKIDANATKTGWSWDSIQQWAELRVDDKMIDARLIITTAETPNIDEARIEAEVEGSTVRVISMNGCTILETGEACPTGTFLTLTPLEKSGDNVELNPGTGIALIGDTPMIVGYQTAS